MRFNSAFEGLMIPPVNLKSMLFKISILTTRTSKDLNEIRVCWREEGELYGTGKRFWILSDRLS